jgi:hypothetical protein
VRPLVLLASLLVWVSSASAQMVTSTPAPEERGNTEKSDSFLVIVHKPRQETIDAVVAAFIANGLEVSNTTNSMVEADLGVQKSLLSVQYTRKVRAIFFGKDSATKVLIFGTETRDDIYHPNPYRIDSRAKKAGGVIWRKMAAVADAIRDTVP